MYKIIFRFAFLLKNYGNKYVAKYYLMSVIKEWKKYKIKLKKTTTKPCFISLKSFFATMLNDKSKQHVLRPLSHKDISRDTITDVTLGQYKYPYNSLLDVDNPLKKNDKRKIDSNKKK